MPLNRKATILHFSYTLLNFLVAGRKCKISVFWRLLRKSYSTDFYEHRKVFKNIKRKTISKIHTSFGNIYLKYYVRKLWNSINRKYIENWREMLITGLLRTVQDTFLLTSWKNYSKFQLVLWCVYLLGTSSVFFRVIDHSTNCT